MSKENPEAFETFEFDLPPIRGFPELRWAGKRPFKSTQYFPAQKKESYGDPTDGWWNRIYWGDNLQVMSHLLREFRGKVDLIYIDPPFDSGADYKKTVNILNKDVSGDHATFEEKQYSDIWSNDEYLQFIYERSIACRELLSESGNFVLHCDSKRSHQIRMILDEVFGQAKFKNEIIWKRKGGSANPKNCLGSVTDTLFWYGSSDSYYTPEFTKDSEEARKYLEERFNRVDPESGRKFMDSPVISPSPRPNLMYEYKGFPPPPTGWSVSEDVMARWDAEGRLMIPHDKTKRIRRKIFADEYKGQPVQNLWNDVFVINSQSSESVGYPTQKPESLLTRIVEMFCPQSGLVLDCFMGSGTAQVVSMKLGRRFIGADINLGAIETAVQRLNRLRTRLDSGQCEDLYGDSETSRTKVFKGFEVYNVNNYDLFRNPVEAKELIREAMELQPLSASSAFDGQREGYLVKIMPVNRIATRQDLNEVINGLDFKAFERRKAEAPNKPVERIHLVCMGHEPDLGSHLTLEAKKSGFDIEVMVTDLIRDKAHLHFKKSSDARLAIENGDLVIAGFFPMNLLQKLSLESDAVEDWRKLVESVKVDFHYDGAVLTPAIVDAPGKDELVSGRYPIPDDAGTIRVKITDLLSESWEGEIKNG